MIAGTATEPAAPPRMTGSATLLPIVCMASALLVLALVQWAAWRHVGGFEYPLDDVYIHLAVAEQIVAGGYGVNPGQWSSPASSPLYPFLLTPFAGTEVQRWLPMAWNVVGLLASAGLFGRILWQAGLSGPVALTLAVTAPVVLNMSGVAAVGMEHSLHMAASLAIVSGLLSHLQTGRLPALLWAGVVLAPALRPEGMALALAAAGVVALRGRWAAGVTLGVLGLAPQVGFALFLRALGLDAVPSSVLTKLDKADDGLFGVLMLNLSDPMGMVLAGLTVLLGLVAIVAIARGQTSAAWMCGACAAAGAAHMLAGQIGWLFRYEPYALAIVAAGLAVGLAAVGRSVALPLGILTVALAGLAGMRFGMIGLPMTARNALAVHLQQAQMGRFAHEFQVAPVAVNDLGWVAWTNPAPVLDLWGLASADARRIRLGAIPPQPGWAAPLADEAGVTMAMIYDNWLAEAAGPAWVRLGTLSMDYSAPRVVRAGIAPSRVALGSTEVAFYAMAPSAVSGLVEALEAWRATLPSGAVFIFDTGLVPAGDVSAPEEGEVAQ